MPAATLSERIDALLPQTQCTKCGYDGCRPYAEAIAAGAADINQCPPGGDAGVAALAELTGLVPKPINPVNGVAQTVPLVAVIREDECIGCTKCIQACPVDAILGAARRMHTVIESECSGCELCVAPCPVDCIDLLDAPDHAPDKAQADQYRRRFAARKSRLQVLAHERKATLARKKAAIAAGTYRQYRASRTTVHPDSDPIAAAVALAQARAATRHKKS